MPKAKAKAKGKRGAPKELEKPHQIDLEDQPSMEGEGEALEGTQTGNENEMEEEDDKGEFEALQRIVEFYEARPYFYNLRHEKYRNTKLKQAELMDLAAEIQWNGEL